MTPQVISIDLGSTYTKVAIRKAGSGSRPAHVLKLDDELLIPSMVVMSKRGGRQRWFTGLEAANLRPTNEDEVYVNWKARLYGNPDSEDNDQSSREAPVRFFKWLKNKLANQVTDIDQSKVRVAIPAFDDDQKSQILRFLVSTMENAGWKGGMVETVEEPLANLLGVTTGGRNQFDDIQIDYASMLPSGSPFINDARRSALYNIDERKIVAIVDIGSYTTDVAHICFMPDEPDGYFAVMGQQSYECGVIEQLESPLFKSFPKNVRAKLSRLSFRERELAKVNLFSKDKDEFYFELDGRQHMIGSADHHRLVTDSIGSFAETISHAVGSSFSQNKPNYICFTGGGSLIRGIKEKIMERITGRLNEILPDHGNRDIMRLGTSLGGASVILDYAKSELYRNPRRRQAIPELKAYHENCSCGGSNPLCPRCYGSGIIK